MREGTFFWPFREAFAVFDIGKPLGLPLVCVAGYSVVCGLIVQRWKIVVLDRWAAASLFNTIILGMLMSFRNRVAYDRWWEARGLWGQLTIDSRNLAAKIAAFVP